MKNSIVSTKDDLKNFDRFIQVGIDDVDAGRMVDGKTAIAQLKQKNPDYFDRNPGDSRGKQVSGFGISF
jgi:hypothetical protein